MLLTFEDLFPSADILRVLRQLAHANQKIYLIGGAVRDALMGSRAHDLDFAVSGDVRSLARNVANALKSPFYMMDVQHQTARVIYTAADGQRWLLDFAALRGFRVEQDLELRDFTVNAMALDLEFPDRLIDPLGGAKDIRAGILRSCYAQAMLDDPIRVLRCVRHSLDWNFKIAPDTLAQVRAASPLLGKTSVERRRDELFRMLDGQHARAAIEVFDQFSALHHLLPELAGLKKVEQPWPHVYDAWTHTLRMVDELQALFELLAADFDEDRGSNLIFGMASLHLGRFRPMLIDHFRARLNPERSLPALLRLAALYHDAGKPEAAQKTPDGRVRFIGHEEIGADLVHERARSLALSTLEVERVTTLVRHHMRIHTLAGGRGEISRRAIFRFFRTLNSAGVDMCLLSLADTLATYGVTISPSIWEAELAICRQLLSAWFEHRQEIIVPKRLISGDELMADMGLSPSPQIGLLLVKIQEAQAAGEISTPAQALAYARKILSQDGWQDERDEDGLEYG